MKKQKSPFNSPLEIGVRCIVLLNSCYPRSLDVNQLVDFDYLLIHSGDAGGPKSLHPPIPLRTGEIIIKRKLIQDALLLMINKQLIKRQVTDKGIEYVLTDSARPFLNAVESNYIYILMERAMWVIKEFGNKSEVELRAVFNKFFDQWTTNFQSIEGYLK